MFNYALITAAGRGSRLMPLTQYVPKAMVEINGVSLISGLIRQLKPAVKNIIVTAGYKGNDVAKHVFEENVSAVYNTNNQGDSWWLFNTPMQFINEPVIVFTCDLVVDLDLNFIYEHYISLGSPVCMLIPIVAPENVGGHFLVGEDNMVKSLSSDRVSNMLASGIFVINPCRVNALLTNGDTADKIWSVLTNLGELRYSPYYQRKWGTVNTVEQLEEF